MNIDKFNEANSLMKEIRQLKARKEGLRGEIEGLCYFLDPLISPILRECIEEVDTVIRHEICQLTEKFNSL